MWHRYPAFRPLTPAALLRLASDTVEEQFFWRVSEQVIRLWQTAGSTSQHSATEAWHA